MAENTCPNTVGGLSDDVTITLQLGGGATSTVDSLGPSVILTGSFDDTNHVMLMSGSFLNQGCTVDVVYDMADPIAVPETGAFGLQLECIPCHVFWLGNFGPL